MSPSNYDEMGLVRPTPGQKKDSCRKRTQSNYDEMGLIRPILGQKKDSWPEKKDTWPKKDSE